MDFTGGKMKNIQGKQSKIDGKVQKCKKNPNMLLLLSALIVFITGSVFASGDPRPLMRFPDIQGNNVVFVHGEDIWKVDSQGGIAQRLTFHDGEERFPKLSPDGKLIAFTGYYDGNPDIYVMSIHGGNIQRVTYHPGNDAVIGWHPSGNKIIFSSGRHSASRYTKLFMISPDGTGLEEMIMYDASNGSFSPDGNRIAYNKTSREFRTWKRYKGGRAQEIYIYDLNKNKLENITNYDGTDRMPMWIGNRIFYSSDRDGVLNIYAYHTNTGKTVQMTKHREYDARRPGFDQNHIVYELGGSLWKLNVSNGKTSQIPVEIRADMPEVRPYLRKVDGYITEIDSSPSGKRALIVARGEIFSVPREDGPTRNLTKTSGVRERNARWSPNGKKIAYFSDAEGEYNLYITDPMGSGTPVRLTQFKLGFPHALKWSPDNLKLAYTDQTLTLYYIDINTRKITKVDKSEYENVDVSLERKLMYDYSWSPDSKYIAYSKMNSDLLYQNYIHDLQTGKNHCVSQGIFSDFSPVFSHDGKHLFFISLRRFNPTYCDFEWEMVYKKASGIYVLTLQKNGQPLLGFKNDEESGESSSTLKSKKSKKAPKVTPKIDFDGLPDRIEPLPLPRGNYRDLAVNQWNVFYLNADEGDFNRFEYRQLGPRELKGFNIKKRKETSYQKGVNYFRLSSNGKHIVFKKGSKIGTFPASPSEYKNLKWDGKTEYILKLNELKVWLHPLEEWRQIFTEAWRFERDFYYEPNMHGLDWMAVRKKYEKILPHCVCRQDIRYLVGEMIGELNTSHTYVFGGDRKRTSQSVNIGMLGVDWSMDVQNKRYRIKKIYGVYDWSREVFPPLRRPGINAKNGEYLLQVNGVDVTTDKNIYSYFQDLAGKQVTLKIGPSPNNQGAREVVVKPLRTERALRYQDWVEGNRLKVSALSNGEIGYIHLPDTFNSSAIEFPKYFYSQTQKKGLVIDGRFNGGGLDPDIFLQRLDKKVVSYWTRRYSHDQASPPVVFRGHMAMITNRYAGSGGDSLPYEFQLKKMGPVIGTRTWGGLVGVSMFIQMIDRGGLTAPDYRIYDKNGKWVVENVGVQPDIVVEIDSLEMSKGRDTQLLKAVEYVKKKIVEDPPVWPTHDKYKVDRY